MTDGDLEWSRLGRGRYGCGAFVTGYLIGLALVAIGLTILVIL